MRSSRFSPKFIGWLSFLVAAICLIYRILAPSVAAQATSPDNRWEVSILMTLVPDETDANHRFARSLQIRDRRTGCCYLLENPFFTRGNVMLMPDRVFWSADSQHLYCLFRESERGTPNIILYEIFQTADLPEPIVIVDPTENIDDTYHGLMKSPKKSDHDIANQIKQVYPFETSSTIMN